MTLLRSAFFHEDNVDTERIKEAYLLSLSNLQHHVLFRPDRIDDYVEDESMQGKFDLLPGSANAC